MTRLICSHPWRAGTCNSCPLRAVAPKAPHSAPKASKPLPVPSQAPSPKTAPRAVTGPSKGYTDAMANMQRCMRALTPADRASVRGQALLAHAELLTAEYRRRMNRA